MTPDDNIATPQGMQRVDCHLCGKTLGWQAEGTPILREHWRHNRCPVRLAQHWDLDLTQIEELTETVKTGIAISLPDFPGDESVRAMRARIAAEQVLELLAGMGVEVRMR